MRRTDELVLRLGFDGAIFGVDEGEGEGEDCRFECGSCGGLEVVMVARTDGGGDSDRCGRVCLDGCTCCLVLCCAVL